MKKIIIKVLEHICCLFAEDSALYLRLYFRAKGASYKLDVVNPVSFNDKLNWMKLHYHNPLLPRLADKFAVKSYVEEKIGKEYVVENLGVWDSPGAIDFDALPDRFVLKCTHDSGGVFICKDKSSFDRDVVIRAIEKKMRRNYYPHLREWVYKDINPRVMADRFLSDRNGKVLLDYKFWCFGGVPKYMYITVKDKDVFENFYDMDYNPVGIDHGFRRHSPEFEKPRSFELMKELAAKLCSGLPFVRVDFFEIEGHPYFGEFTFYDWGGLQPFKTKEMDVELGSLIHLPQEQL